MEQNIKIFDKESVRRIWHNEEWYFVITDVIQVLTDSKNPQQYLKNIKKRDPELFKGGVKIETPLLIDTAGGKQKIKCANRQGIFRLLMSISSPKVEPFKQWMAQISEQYIEEIENPEIGIERLKEVYRIKGYSDEWIETRLKSIDIRRQLTDEWKERGIKEGQDYAILTAEIARATFGLAPNEHKQLKGLDKENLRDHMNNLELIFTMLGEEATRKITVDKDAIGFSENLDAAQEGGSIAGTARQSVEARGMKVITAENFLHLGLKEGDAKDK